jgi:hypothetical protein
MAKSWLDDGNEIATDIDVALDALRFTSDWLWRNVVADDVWPRQMPEELAVALEKMDGALRAAKDFARYPGEHVASKFLAARVMTRDEFYTLCALGGGPPFNVSGLCPFDEYEIYTFFCYEDDEQWTYINPDKKPPTPSTLSLGVVVKLVGGFGIAPEEVRISFLHPDEREFFRKYLPEVFARFKDA